MASRTSNALNYPLYVPVCPWHTSQPCLSTTPDNEFDSRQIAAGRACFAGRGTITLIMGWWAIISRICPDKAWHRHVVSEREGQRPANCRLDHPCDCQHTYTLPSGWSGSPPASIQCWDSVEDADSALYDAVPALYRRWLHLRGHSGVLRASHVRTSQQSRPLKYPTPETTLVVISPGSQTVDSWQGGGGG